MEWPILINFTMIPRKPKSVFAIQPSLALGNQAFCKTNFCFSHMHHLVIVSQKLLSILEDFRLYFSCNICVWNQWTDFTNKTHAWGSGCESVGRADARSLQFESSHRQTFITKHLFGYSQLYWKDEKIKRRPRMAHF